MRRQAAAKQQIRVGEHGPQPLVGSHVSCLKFRNKGLERATVILYNNNIAIAITGKPKLLRLEGKQIRLILNLMRQFFKRKVAPLFMAFSQSAR